MSIAYKQTITFPEFTGIRCLMMPFIQGDVSSLPEMYAPYFDILSNLFCKKGDVGFLTIDESFVGSGKVHRGSRAKESRALHTEAGIRPTAYGWGKPWGGRDNVLLDDDVTVILANNLDDSCALWNATHKDTTEDGDLGHLADMYPYSDATMMKSGEAWEIGILTPHESMPVTKDFNRQFLRIVSSGVHGSEDYFTKNPLVQIA